MAVKDSALPAASALAGTETVAVVQAGVSKRSTAAAIAAVLAGIANGVCPLDADSKIPTMYLPALAVTTVTVVASEAAQLALTAEMGDVAIRTDISTTYIHNGGTAGTIADWTEWLAPASPVQSVNGQTGTVALDAADVGAVDAGDVGAVNGVGSLDAAAQQPVTERRRKIVALGNITGATNIDLASGDIITATLIGNVTLSFVNLPAAGYVADCEVRFTQDATGGRTATQPAGGQWPGAAPFALTNPVAPKFDAVTYVVDSAGSYVGYPVEAIG